MTFTPTNRLVDYFVVCGLGEDLQERPRTVDSGNDNDSGSAAIEITDLIFQSTIIDRFPMKDYPSGGVSPELPMFCIPHGVQVSTRCDIPALFTFVLTHSDGARMYASCLLFYETLSDEQEARITNLLTEVRRERDQRNLRMRTPRGRPTKGQQEVEKGGENAGSIGDGGHGGGDDGGDGEGGNDIREEMAGGTGSDEIATPSPPQVLTREYLEALETAEAEKQRRISSKKQPYYITKAFCIISHYPMFRTFKSFLTQLYRISLSPGHIPIERYISNFCLEMPLPPRGRVQVQYTIGERIIMISRPPVNELPLLDVDAETLFSVLSVDNILAVMNCMLNERQILLLASHFSLLGTAAETLCSLIYPFAWQHVYIPVLPRACLEFLHAPVPFLMGVHTSVFVEDELPEDVIVVDLDKNRVHINQTQRLPNLPERQHLKLRNSLLKILEKTPPKKFDGLANDMAFALAPTPDMADDELSQKTVAFPLNEVRQAFFRFFVAVFVKYRSYIIKPGPNDDPYQDFNVNKYFRRVLFIKEHPDNAKHFLRAFLDMQCFQRFLLDRLTGENEHEVRFFDESITAKLKRSIKSRLLLNTRRRDTKFLDDKSLRVNRTVVALSPNTVGTIPGSRQYVYPSFPKLNPELFPPPREVGQLVTTDELMQAEGKENKILDSWKTIISTLGALSSQLAQISYRRKYARRRRRSLQLSGDMSSLHERSRAFDSQELDESSPSTFDISSITSSNGFLYAITPLYFRSKTAKGDIKERSTNKNNDQDDLDEDSATSIDSMASIGGIHEDTIFSQFCFDTSEQCPSCNQILLDNDVRNGWSAHAHDYRTTCVHCNHQFVPRFSVSINRVNGAAVDEDESMDISQTSSSHMKDMSLTSGNTGSSMNTIPLSNTASAYGEQRRQGVLFEYLSPVLLKKEVENLLNKRVLADTNLLFNHPLVFWNLIVHFRNIGIPLNFFLPQVDWKEMSKEMERIIAAQSEEQPNKKPDVRTQNLVAPVQQEPKPEKTTTHTEAPAEKQTPQTSSEAAAIEKGSPDKSIDISNSREEGSQTISVL